mmetsp:Transcript_4566/g.10273  ORF Transcript_4566/g.10273 Transcript_4566/m.10273 type:complete len:240 (+) Transcript_4566:447-1166(+)
MARRPHPARDDPRRRCREAALLRQPHRGVAAAPAAALPPLQRRAGTLYQINRRPGLRERPLSAQIRRARGDAVPGACDGEPPLGGDGAAACVHGAHQSGAQQPGEPQQVRRTRGRGGAHRRDGAVQGIRQGAETILLGRADPLRLRRHLPNDRQAGRGLCHNERHADAQIRRRRAAVRLLGAGQPSPLGRGGVSALEEEGRSGGVSDRPRDARAGRRGAEAGPQRAGGAVAPGEGDAEQ